MHPLVIAFYCGFRVCAASPRTPTQKTRCTREPRRALKRTSSPPAGQDTILAHRTRCALETSVSASRRTGAGCTNRRPAARGVRSNQRARSRLPPFRAIPACPRKSRAARSPVHSIRYTWRTKALYKALYTRGVAPTPHAGARASIKIGLDARAKEKTPRAVSVVSLVGGLRTNGCVVAYADLSGVRQGSNHGRAVHSLVFVLPVFVRGCVV